MDLLNRDIYPIEIYAIVLDKTKKCCDACSQPGRLVSLATDETLRMAAEFTESFLEDKYNMKLIEDETPAIRIKGIDWEAESAGKHCVIAQKVSAMSNYKDEIKNGRTYFCERTGAHFHYRIIFEKLEELREIRQSTPKAIVLTPEHFRSPDDDEMPNFNNFSSVDPHFTVATWG